MRMMSALRDEMVSIQSFGEKEFRCREGEGKNFRRQFQFSPSVRRNFDSQYDYRDHPQKRFQFSPSVRRNFDLPKPPNCRL